MNNYKNKNAVNNYKEYYKHKLSKVSKGNYKIKIGINYNFIIQRLRMYTIPFLIQLIHNFVKIINIWLISYICQHRKEEAGKMDQVWASTHDNH